MRRTIQWISVVLLTIACLGIASLRAADICQGQVAPASFNTSQLTPAPVAPAGPQQVAGNPNGQGPACCDGTCPQEQPATVETAGLTVQEEVPAAAATPNLVPTPGLTSAPDQAQVAATCPPGSTCSSPCDWVDCCSLIAGGEATFLYPNFHRSAQNLFVDSGTAFSTTSDASSIDNKMLVAPRIWLGAQGPKWGVVGRYWNAALANAAYNPSIPVTDTGTTSFDRFSAYLVDFEVQRLFCGCNWNHRMGFGVRYGAVNLDTNNNLLSLGNANLASATALQGNQFYGTGLTWGLFSLRPIKDSCWSVYVAPRFSILWGQSQAVAQTSATAADLSGGAASVNGALSRIDNSLFIAELGWGVQWDRQLSWSPARAFIRFGGEYQYWDTSNSHSQAAATSFAISPTSAALASVNGTNSLLFSLIGFTFSTGIVY